MRDRSPGSWTSALAFNLFIEIVLYRIFLCYYHFWGEGGSVGYFLGGPFWQELGENFAFQSGLSLTM